MSGKGALWRTLNTALHANSEYGRRFDSSTHIVSVKKYCYGVIYVRGHGWEYKFYPEGTPCRLPFTRYPIGLCSRGICIANSTAEAKMCSNLYNAGGYPTQCHSSACDGMPCINLFNQPRRSFAGLCISGQCVSAYELSVQNETRAHPEKFHRCSTKDHTGRNVLSSCYHYCERDNAWYYGYYSSNVTNACYLAQPTRNQYLGWCCQGRCIEMAHCYAS
uniref:18.3 kDa family n=1 Tax=Rhipicephalus zambeziensis TaxID=60191 RepID=A0A224Y0P3_9ACAR